MVGIPLLVTADEVMRGRVERAAAAAQVRLASWQIGGAASVWLRSPLVLIDAGQVCEAAQAGLSTPARIVVVASRPLSEREWAACVTLRVERVVSIGDAGEDALVDVLADAADNVDHPHDGRCIAVVGSVGGAGASVFTAAITRQAAVSGTALCCDLDSRGGGLELLLGLESVAGARWRDIDAAHGRVAASALYAALPRIGDMKGTALLLGFGDEPTHEVDAAVVESVMTAVQRAGDTVVVDLPDVTSPVAERVVRRAGLTVLVVPAEVRACYAAARLLPLLDDLGARVGVVVRGPSPGGLGAADIGDALGVPVLAAMRPQSGLPRSVDAGLGLGRTMRGPLQRAADAVLVAVSQHPDDGDER